MVSMCLPSDPLLQYLPSYLVFSYPRHGVCLHGCSSKAQPLLLTLDEGYLLTTALPNLQRGIALLGPPVPAQPQCGAGPPGHRPWPRAWGCSSRPPPLALGLGGWGISSQPWPLTSDAGYLLSVAPPDLRHGVGPLGRSCAVAVWHSRLLPLTSDAGYLLSAAPLTSDGV